MRKKTVKMTLVINEYDEGAAYAVGFELEEGGKPYRVYSLYYTQRDEVTSKRQAAQRAIKHAISDLPDDVGLLMVASPNRLTLAYKRHVDRVGSTTELPQRLDVYMRRIRASGSRVKRADMLADDAARRRRSVVCAL